MTEQPNETPAPSETPAAEDDQPTTPAPTTSEPEQPERPTETVAFWKQKAREQEARAKANADAAKKLKEIEDRDLSELDRAKRDAETATQRLADMERTSLRQRVALDKGVPASLVDRLQGSTEDEVSADADALLALIKTPAGPKPDPSQGARTPSAEDAGDAEYYRFFPDEAPNR